MKFAALGKVGYGLNLGANYQSWSPSASALIDVYMVHQQADMVVMTAHSVREN